MRRVDIFYLISHIETFDSELSNSKATFHLMHYQYRSNKATAHFYASISVRLTSRVMWLLCETEPTKFSPEDLELFKKQEKLAPNFLPRFASFPKQARPKFLADVQVTAPDLKTVVTDAGAGDNSSRISDGWAMLYHGTLRVRTCYEVKIYL
jgi:hypothetical protein